MQDLEWMSYRARRTFVTCETVELWTEAGLLHARFLVRQAHDGCALRAHPKGEALPPERHSETCEMSRRWRSSRFVSSLTLREDSGETMPVAFLGLKWACRNMKPAGIDS